MMSQIGFLTQESIAHQSKREERKLCSVWAAQRREQSSYNQKCSLNSWIHQLPGCPHKPTLPQPGVTVDIKHATASPQVWPPEGGARPRCQASALQTQLPPVARITEWGTAQRRP